MKKAQEKNLEKRLRLYVEKCGGECLKFSSSYSTGWQDRFILLPGGYLILVEAKSGGKDLSELQKARKRKVEKMGFPVFKLDSEETLKQIKNAIQTALIPSSRH